MSSSDFHHLMSKLNIRMYIASSFPTQTSQVRCFLLGKLSFPLKNIEYENNLETI